MTSIFNLDKYSDDEITDSINIDDLYEKKRNHDLNKLKSYKKILTNIHNRIKVTSRQYMSVQHCWYVIPEIILGMPHYDHVECIEYVMHALHTNGFDVTYTHPNLIFICWANWVPSHVRSEIKNKMGVQVDSFGGIIKPNMDTNNDPPRFNMTKLDKRPTVGKLSARDTSTTPNNTIYDTDMMDKFNVRFSK